MNKHIWFMLIVTVVIFGELEQLPLSIAKAENDFRHMSATKFDRRFTNTQQNLNIWGWEWTNELGILQVKHKTTDELSILMSEKRDTIADTELSALNRADYSRGFFDSFDGYKRIWSNYGSMSFYPGFLRVFGLKNDRPEVWFNQKSYRNFYYSVRMKRSGCSTCVNDIKFRDTGLKSGYFGYTNNGYYTVYSNTGTWIGWTKSAAINKGGTNELAVYAYGNYYQFYINNRLVASGNRVGLSTGVVGIDFYSPTRGGNFLDVDWVYLSTY
jgi:hypothetical protein